MPAKVEIKRGKAGFTWTLLSNNKIKLARSAQAYKTRTQCVRNILSVASRMYAPIVDWAPSVKKPVKKVSKKPVVLETKKTPVKRAR